MANMPSRTLAAAAVLCAGFALSAPVPLPAPAQPVDAPVVMSVQQQREVAALTALEPVISRLIGVHSDLERALAQVTFGEPRP